MNDLQLGKDAYAARKFKTALCYLLKWLHHQPESWEARYYIGHCYVNLNMIASATNTFTLIGERCPDISLRADAESALKALSARSN